MKIKEAWALISAILEDHELDEYEKEADQVINDFIYDTLDTWPELDKDE